MAAIARIAIDFESDIPSAWDRLAQCSDDWLAERALARRDAIVLVPLAQHLAHARHAFAGRGGWLPRIETTRTLCAALPPVQRPEGAIEFDVAQDRLRARQMLQAQAWARAWAGRDRQAFEQTVARLVDCAHALARHASTLPPAQRPAWEARARSLVGAQEGPGGSERLLARLALEWVISSAPWPTDALFGCAPRAWIVVQAGGVDRLAESLLAASVGSSLVLHADPDADDPLSALAQGSAVSLARCDDFEDEAERAAAQVLAWLGQGHRPIALVAQDRVLVRRIGALLARREVPLLDETGWKLSTTRAAASLMAMLRTATHGASCDEWLDWLKSLPGDADAAALDGLEAALRRAGLTRVERLAQLPLAAAEAASRDRAMAWLAALGSGRKPLAQWMRLLRDALGACGLWQALQADAAGVQVIAALRLEAPEAAWHALSQDAAMRWFEFTQVVDELLEQAVFEPPAPPGDAAVVVTPLRRAVLRPFAAAMLPGADERRLGAPPPADALLGEGLASALGLPSRSERQRDEAVAFAQLLRVPLVALSHRHQDDGELLECSPLVERLALWRERAAAPLGAARDARLEVIVHPAASERPAPTAVGHLPSALSASAVEALRDCPYRFFARSVLALQAPEELDEEAEKRDYGNWLHAVLLRFHARRLAGRVADEDLEQLRACAAEERAAAQDDPSFLPFEASFERFAPLYVQWLQQRDADGARWLEGESEREARPPLLGGLALRGRIDRIDLVGGSRELIDYKTSPLKALRERVRDPLEDTQLAFYAALEAQRDPDAALQAIYLALDDSEGVKPVVHPDVSHSAERLLEGLGDELKRLREGAPLHPLGEGQVCEHCEARGLCRRDDWGGA
jgi:ATP-dependent helicase/nuclease subunit B